jgi:predicted TIM-barrel fold metal-dependent hydrolase
MSEGRIDIHQHAVPPAWQAALAAGGHTAGGWKIPEWSRDAAIAMMDRREIRAGVLSMTAPGTHLGGGVDPAALAKACNEEMAEVVRERPDRFGMFAFLPLPDVDATLDEIARAAESLDVDGFMMLSSTQGKYLGDPDYEQVWAELDQRRSVVFVHPNVPPLPLMRGLPAPVLDFVFDTTRTALDLALSGTLDRYPNVQVVLSHGGGFMPYTASRFAATASVVVPGLEPGALERRLRRFWLDTALSSSPVSTPTLLAFADPGHLVYGSDWPFLPEEVGVRFDRMLDAQAADGSLELSDAQWRNAAQLLPSVAQRLGILTLPRQRSGGPLAAQPVAAGSALAQQRRPDHEQVDVGATNSDSVSATNR